MPTKKKKPKTPTKKNHTDPNLLARSVMEAFLGEPVNPKKPRKTQPARSKPATISREKKARLIKRRGSNSLVTRPGHAKKSHSRPSRGLSHKR